MYSTHAKRTLAGLREQLVEWNTELLSYAQGSLNEAFEAFKAMINAATMQEAMQVQISYTLKTIEQAKKFCDLYAKANHEVAEPISRGDDAGQQNKKVGLNGADETAKRMRLAR